MSEDPKDEIDKTAPHKAESAAPTDAPEGDLPDDVEGELPDDVEGDLPELDDDDGAAIRALLKRSLAPPAGDAEEAPEPELLAAVQRKIRQRSRGKFYADGWSTTQSRLNYVLVAAVMLVTVVVVYIALGPMGISP
jgi:hypothetical protein